jgi:uncharacterized protein (DUF433 family)
MTEDELLLRITIRPEQCHGHPCIRGMRIRVLNVMEMLAGGMTLKEILADFPCLETDDIQASLAFATKLVRECREHSDQTSLQHT